MSMESNREHFKNMLKECGHPGGSGRFREEMYPLLLVVVKSGDGDLEMCPLSQGGDTSKVRLLASLHNAHKVFLQAKDKEVEQEREHAGGEKLRS